MKGFAQHGINHTSASSINMWAEDPAAWLARYVGGCRFTFSPAARAGVIAEKAVANVLFGMSQAEATEMAVTEFKQATRLDFSEKTASRGDAIPGMIDLALKELAPYGTPEFNSDGSQKKIEINCRVDDWTIPVTGFLDFDFPRHGLVVDLKTTSRLPSEMSSSHLRQQAIYKAATGNKAVKFLYVTGKKSAMYEPEDTSDTLLEIKAILRRQDKFLQMGPWEVLKDIVPVMPSFYWADDVPLRRELYGY